MSGRSVVLDAEHGRRHRTSGLVLALISAVAFGTSGTLAHGLLDTGWSPAAATLARLTVAAVLIAPLGWIALRRAAITSDDSSWQLLRRNFKAILVYGVFALAGTQLAYFASVQLIPVGIALLIEYTAPVAVVLYLWRWRQQRPTSFTVLGALVAAGGLVLMLDLGGAGLDVLGVLFGALAMVGAALYFVLSSDSQLPPLTLAGAGFGVGAVAIALLGGVGLLPLHWSVAPAQYGQTTVPVWVAVVSLGVLPTAVAYTTGVAGAQRLGSRLASFVALVEVVAALLIAWWVLDEQPHAIQIAGGVLILLGLVLVRMAERPKAVTATHNTS